MSRKYHMSLEVRDYNEAKSVEIKEVSMEHWSFSYWWDGATDYDGHLRTLVGDGESYLCGGESEEEFAARLTLSIWKANGGPCEVVINATYLEEIPYETYSFDQDNPPEGWEGTT